MLIDDYGNKADPDFFGSVEAAKDALKSLKGCVNCVNCVNCTACVECDECKFCVDCVKCNYCKSCENCNGCESCSLCVSCTGCLDCGQCENCQNLFACQRCKRCSYSVKCHLGEDLVDCYRREKFDINIFPIIENIHTVVYEKALQGLNMDYWHTCDTVHCRAGWVTHLADAQVLEEKYGHIFSAMMIYKRSGYEISPVRFFDEDSKALEDMKNVAAKG